MSFLTLKSWMGFKSTVESVAYDVSRCLCIYNGLLQFKDKSLKSTLTNDIALKCVLGGFQGDKNVLDVGLGRSRTPVEGEPLLLVIPSRKVIEGQVLSVKREAPCVSEG